MDVGVNKKMWNIAWDIMWEHRNGAFHHSKTAHQQIIESQINDKIQHLYVAGPQALPQDVLHFLHQPLDHQLMLPMTAQLQWVESVELAVKWKNKLGHR